jgi:DNA-directed RNA polymerase specialized sigma subunit
MMMETEGKNEGMNQREVAEALGVSRSLIQKVEKQAIEKVMRLLARRKIKREDFF